MSLRLIQLFLPDSELQDALQLLEDKAVPQMWHEHMGGKNIHIQILIPADQAEDVLDTLEKKYTKTEGFRILLLPVEAAIPRPDIPKKKTPPVGSGEQSKKEGAKPVRISRAELYADIAHAAEPSRVYLILVMLSTIVAALGLMRDSEVIVIAAMVLAPLLGPNVALALGTTLGDIQLSRKAIQAIFMGSGTALLLAVAAGLLVSIDPEIPGLLSRTQVDISDIILALSAGGAAVLSFTSGLMSALIAVMVAVALLPPLVTMGIFLGAGRFELALGAFLLLMTNLICVNLAGVLTFLLQGVRPLTWWEASKAKKATRQAILLWSIMLMGLAVVILLST
jgi:uncharacterized hydrophobic protein (TIGR00341 family)